MYFKEKVGQFYSYVRVTYGNFACSLLKKISNLKVILTKLNCRKSFLEHCRSNKICPKFLRINEQKYSHLNQKKGKGIINGFYKKFLNLEIEHSFRMVAKHQWNIDYNIGRVSNFVPSQLLEGFLNKQKEKCERLFIKIRNVHVKKLNRLMNENCNLGSFVATGTNEFSDKWLVNLSKAVPSDREINALKLAPKNSLSVHLDERIVPRIISEFEGCIQTVDENTKDELRLSFASCLTMACRKDNINKPDPMWNEVAVCKKFVTDNPEVYITRADKGNVTVLIDRSEYNNKIQALLNDSNTYQLVNKDPTASLQLKNNKLANGWLQKNFIDNNLFVRIRVNNSVAPRMYGLPKIHKPGCELRPIVSNINSPLYNLAQVYNEILSKVVWAENRGVKDSFIFKNEIENIVIPQGYIMCSLDVTSLFTNLPIELLPSIISKRWGEVSKFTSIPEEEFFKGLRLLMEGNVFVWEGKYYKQIYGTPMGSPISPTLGNIILSFLEEQCLPLLLSQPLIYKRYVDDIFMVVKEDSLEQIVDTFNNFHHRLKFTIEKEQDGSLPFLDVLVIREGRGVITNWYRKPSYSGRYLNFKCYHPKAYKISVMNGLIDRAVGLAKEQFWNDNLHFVEKVLLANNYPIKLIKSVIKNRLKKLKTGKRNDNRDSSPEQMTYRRMTYMGKLTHVVKRKLKKHGVEVVMTPANNIQQLFHSKLKDGVPTEKQSNLVYEVNCLGCQAVYVGQTKQRLEDRMRGHKQSIQRGDREHSMLVAHTLETGHHFDFSKVTIKEKEKNLLRRHVLEMCHIVRSENAINKRSDFQGLHKVYHNLLKNQKS